MKQNHHILCDSVANTLHMFITVQTVGPKPTILWLTDTGRPEVTMHVCEEAGPHHQEPAGRLAGPGEASEAQWEHCQTAGADLGTCVVHVAACHGNSCRTTCRTLGYVQIHESIKNKVRAITKNKGLIRASEWKQFTKCIHIGCFAYLQIIPLSLPSGITSILLKPERGKGFLRSEQTSVNWLNNYHNYHAVSYPQRAFSQSHIQGLTDKGTLLHLGCLVPTLQRYGHPFSSDNHQAVTSRSTMRPRDFSK